VLQLFMYPCGAPGLGTPAVREEVATGLWSRPFTVLENLSVRKSFQGNMGKHVLH
jgi:hypothetical protein